MTITDAGGLSVTSSVTVAVSPEFTSISVSPATVNVDLYATQQFTAVARDQFGGPLAGQPNFGWTASSGTITSTGPSPGLFTPAKLGSITITAACGSIRGTATASVFNAAPTVATAANVSANPVTGATAALAVMGADNGGESNLTYKWSTTKLPSSAPAPKFSAGGTNAAKNTTVTFGAAGSYSFTATITDSFGLSATSSVTVAVNLAFGSISVSPAAVSVDLYSTQQFAAVGWDQFGSPLAVQPNFGWTAGSGEITSTGLFSPSGPPGNVTITALSGSIRGSATATVFNDPPAVATAASASPGLVTGTMAALAVLGADDGGEGNLAYRWSATVLNGARPLRSAPTAPTPPRTRRSPSARSGRIPSP